MKFYSTKDKQLRVGLKEAVIQGLAPDKGLYMPEGIPQLSASFFSDLSKRSNTSIAFDITSHLLGDAIPKHILKDIIEKTVAFDVPLVQVEERVWSLELFHGPTLAFKDFGAQFLASLLGYFALESNHEITILVATSGDTGSAVAHGFFGVPGTRVVVLYPSGKVSELQEKQITTFAGNIQALEVDGTFDDCQRLVKQAFQHKELNKQLTLTSANSINIARLIPQSFYYFFAYAQLQKEVIFSVPSGNFGNLTGGIIAMKMGLPVESFIAATNVNDVVPIYLQGGKFQPRSSIQTISNAMDVGDPSNFERLLDLFDHRFDLISKWINGYAFTDEETKQAMKAVHQSTGYVLDPHGAVAYLGLQQARSENEFPGVFLETAHPGKFCSVVEEVIGQPVVLPQRLISLKQKEKKATRISNQFDDLREFLTQ